MSIASFFVNRIREMVSFEFSEDMEKYFYRLVLSVGQRVPMRNRTSDLEIQ